METNEAAAALLNMESPNNILDEKRMRTFICINILRTIHFWVHRQPGFSRVVLMAHLCFCVSCLCSVHTYGALLESDLTYAPLRPEQMDNGALDMSPDEDTSSMDEIPKCPLKPQKKTKGSAVFLPRLLKRCECQC